MGATTFVQYATGETAEAAFAAAVAKAQYDYGHSGYTGTIAEKHDFILLPLSDERRAELNEYPYSFSYAFNDPDWDKVDDKWGPAGCYDLGDGRYLFFGWASE